MKIEKERLAADIKDRMRSSSKRARFNYVLAYGLGICAVVASIITTVSLAVDWLPKAMNVILAAIPGVAISLAAFFRFEDRAEWWWAKHHKLDALCRELLYEGKHESDVSKELTDFIVMHEKIWPKFGKLPIRPNVP